MQQHAKDRTHSRQWSSCDANSEMERLLAKDAPKDRDLAHSAGVVFEEDEIVPGCAQRPGIKPLIPNDGAKFMHRFAQGQQDPVDSAGGCQSPGSRPCENGQRPAFVTNQRRHRCELTKEIVVTVDGSAACLLVLCAPCVACTAGTK